MTESTARIEVSTADLLTLLREAMPFASHDGSLPMINCVGFEFAGTDLLAVATDRYMLAVAKLPIGQTIVQPPRSIRIGDAESIVRQFKPPRGMNPMLALEFGEQSFAVETTATLDDQPTMRLAFPWSSSGKMPEWRKLLTADDAATEPLVASFNPQYLARFAQIQRDVEPITVWPTAPNKPWRVTIGDHFVGVIMPVRMPDSGAQVWTPAAVNVAPEPKAKPRRARAARKAA